MKIKDITGHGQIKEGDLLLLEKKNGVVFPAVAKCVINQDSKHEEIILSKSKNLYFIMSMMMDGISWIKSCKRVEDGKMYSISNNMNEWVS